MNVEACYKNNNIVHVCNHQLFSPPSQDFNDFSLGHIVSHFIQHIMSPVIMQPANTPPNTLMTTTHAGTELPFLSLQVQQVESSRAERKLFS